MPVSQLSTSLQDTVNDITARDEGNKELLGQLKKGVLQELIQWHDQSGDVAVRLDSDATTYYNPDTPRVWK